MRPTFRPLVAALLLASCTSPAGEPPAVEPAAQASIDRLVESLRTAGVPVTRVEPMRSRQEFPGCAEAELRTRIHFDGGRFVNVSRFHTPEQAQACLDIFREIALRAGPTGWERLKPTISTNGPWLYLFPSDLRDGAFRKQVLDALVAAGG